METHIVERKIQTSCLQQLADFANIFKAFIGANYLTIPFNFRQSGLALGAVGLILIALMTDHCCQLIVKCKYAAINKVMSLYRSQIQTESGDMSEDEIKSVHKRLLAKLTYGDIGHLSFGRLGLVIVNICLLFTQFGFCVSYFIFIGNTFYTLFPMYNVTEGNGSIYNITASPVANISSIQLTELPVQSDFDDRFTETNPDYDVFGNGSISDVTQDWGTLWGSNAVFGNGSISNVTADWSNLWVSNAPPLEYLILIPLPFFIMFAIIRHMRHLGVISIFADVSIFIGCVCVLAYLLTGFTLSDSYKLVKGSSFPIFFGGVTGAFEGIGTILPIESSMEGNRENFTFFLHGAVFLLSFILSVFGVLGYLRFGEFSEQTINSNITPLDSPIARIVNVTLCLGILLTFPLQLYPVIEIAEGYLFAEGRCCGPKSRGYSGLSSIDNEDVSPIMTEEEEVFIESDENVNMPVAVEIPNSVSAWKRNTFRISLVLVACGVAVLCRNFYAYFSAFVGAIGSTMLAYILPCLFHLKLAGHRLSWRIWFKDIFIIIVGLFGGVMSVYTVIREVVMVMHNQ